jgi:hypothetical protein
MVLMLAQPAAAKTLTGSIVDPAGDAIWYVHKNQPVPGYLDIVGASIALDGDVFTMTIEMAVDIPDEPVFVKAAHVYWWELGFDTGPGFYPIFPFGSTKEERNVGIEWDGEEWSAELCDYTSVQNWKDPVLTYSLPLIRDGNQFVVEVDSDLMGAETFLWGAGTLGWMTPSPAGTASWAWWPFDGAGMDDITGEWTSWPE